jgi:hypothetical protein
MAAKEAVRRRGWPRSRCRCEEQQKIEKIRRQKRKRSKKAKQKMLEDKRRRAVVKMGRAFRPGPEDL